LAGDIENMLQQITNGALLNKNQNYNNASQFDKSQLAILSKEILEKELEKAVKDDNFEYAAKLRDELDKRK
jgi:protein-arginine kinase activator protein McsA